MNNNTQTFYTIMQKHCDSKNIFYPEEKSCADFWINVYKHEINSHNPYSFIKSIIYQLINIIHSKLQKQYYVARYPKAKFVALKKIFENMFLTDAQKEEILVMFSKIQRTYWSFSRLAFLYKIKKTKIKYSTDLCLNPIDATKRHVITIYQNGATYLFVIPELINIIESALSNSVNFFHEPLPIKNPYNNVRFSVAILHHIYFFIKTQTCLMSQLFHLYFLDNFNLTEFGNNNECIIREITIKNYAFTTPAFLLKNVTSEMISQNYYARQLVINNLFPKERLVDIMRPYLHLYYISKYSLNPDKKEHSRVKLLNKLHQFYNYNKLFGRIICAPHSSQKTFNEDCVNFYSKPKNATNDSNDWTFMSNRFSQHQYHTQYQQNQNRITTNHQNNANDHDGCDACDDNENRAESDNGSDLSDNESDANDNEVDNGVDDVNMTFTLNYISSAFGLTYPTDE